MAWARRVRWQSGDGVIIERRYGATLIDKHPGVVRACLSTCSRNAGHITYQAICDVPLRREALSGLGGRHCRWRETVRTQYLGGDGCSGYSSISIAVTSMSLAIFGH